MELHPLAKYCDSSEGFAKLKKHVDIRNKSQNIEFDLDEKQLEKEMKKVKDKIDKTFKNTKYY